jgi:hypothetical protein
MSIDDETTGRKRDAGQALPEDNQPGMGIDARDHVENDAVPDETHDQRSDRDGEPSQATGNPRAAGG